MPKWIGLNNPEPLACAIAQPIRLLSRLTAPVSMFLSRVSILSSILSGVISFSRRANKQQPHLPYRKAKVYESPD
ncbi:MAG: hypothetical protein HC771_24135 [Synechococcales cyanobacterium CRU_2_2]|nr:hypothetical protein [Synechococcales cyanobacterium CRU_2_2]